MVKWYEKIHGLQENLDYIHNLLSEVKSTKSALRCIMDFKDLFRLSQISGLFPQETTKSEAGIPVVFVFCLLFLILEELNSVPFELAKD